MFRCVCYSKVEMSGLFLQNSLCVSGARDGSVKLTNLKTHKILCGYKHTSKDEEENCSVEAQRYWFNDHGQSSL